MTNDSSDGGDGEASLDDAPRLLELLELLPASTSDIADAMDVAPTTVESYRNRVQETHGVELEYGREANEWRRASGECLIDGDGDSDGETGGGLPDLSGVDVSGEPDPTDLTSREAYIARELQTGATVDGLADDLDERASVVTQHLRDLKQRGWRVYVDETAGHVAITGDHVLRSSEHKGTRTRKANRWWELRHNDLVREFRALSTPTAALSAESGREDWVLHLTDLHAGDRVRRDDGTVVYATSDVPDVIDYVTEKALALADKHASTYDTGHLLWGGDFLTNSAIYEGQFEDLDAWLDEQHATLVAPLIRQLKAFAERFPAVQVVTMVGNHGQHRASGRSRQANADLILYKHLRNTVAELQAQAGILENVRFEVGDAAPYRNFELRGGGLVGHLRHGQHRRPQAETSAREKEWAKTLLDHDFDIAYMGHYHVSGRIPWDGPPIVASSSPKPAGEFVERLGGRLPSDYQDVATVHGVSDDGLTGVYPIDTRHYDAP
jgi:Mn-dependent DtxR family transcriptional regulator